MTTFDLDAPFSALASALAVLSTITRTDIAFSGSAITAGSGLSAFPRGGIIQISGSSSNDGLYAVETVSDTEIVVEANLVAEAAGASITINWGPLRVYEDPAEAIHLSEFPVIVLGLAPLVRGRWDRASIGIGLHRPTIAIWVFVGARNTPLPILHSRVKKWVAPIADVLHADQRLSNTVTYIGPNGAATGETFQYLPGPIQWADGEYFGLTILLPLAIEKQQLHA